MTVEIIEVIVPSQPQVIEVVVPGIIHAIEVVNLS
jgi:hypothetical protein